MVGDDLDCDFPVALRGTGCHTEAFANVVPAPPLGSHPHQLALIGAQALHPLQADHAPRMAVMSRCSSCLLWSHAPSALVKKLNVPAQRIDQLKRAAAA